MMSQTVELADAPKTNYVMLPGECLRVARLEAKLTQDEVARRLRLRVSIIEDIENDSYNHMPELVFVRGYLRAYAQLLGLSGDELIAGFNEFNQKEENANNVLWQSHKHITGRERFLRWFTVLCACGLLTWAALWWRSQGTVNLLSQSGFVSVIPSSQKLLGQSEGTNEVGELKTQTSAADTQSTFEQLKKHLYTLREKKKEV